MALSEWLLENIKSSYGVSTLIKELCQSYLDWVKRKPTWDECVVDNELYFSKKLSYLVNVFECPIAPVRTSKERALSSIRLKCSTPFIVYVNLSILLSEPL